MECDKKQGWRGCRENFGGGGHLRDCQAKAYIRQVPQGLEAGRRVLLRRVAVRMEGGFGGGVNVS